MKRSASNESASRAEFGKKIDYVEEQLKSVEEKLAAVRCLADDLLSQHKSREFISMDNIYRIIVHAMDGKYLCEHSRAQVRKLDPLF